MGATVDVGAGLKVGDSVALAVGAGLAVGASVALGVSWANAVDTSKNPTRTAASVILVMSSGVETSLAILPRETGNSERFLDFITLRSISLGMTKGQT
jgi:hypothetical protein